MIGIVSIMIGILFLRGIVSPFEQRGLLHQFYTAHQTTMLYKNYMIKAKSLDFLNSECWEFNWIILPVTELDSPVQNAKTNSFPFKINPFLGFFTVKKCTFCGVVQSPFHPWWCSPFQVTAGRASLDNCLFTQDSPGGPFNKARWLSTFNLSTSLRLGGLACSSFLTHSARETNGYWSMAITGDSSFVFPWECRSSSLSVSHLSPFPKRLAI